MGHKDVDVTLTFPYMLEFVGASAVRGDVVLKHDARLQLGT